MTFTGITATEAQIDQKSGANVSASFTDVMKTQSLLQAESYINCETKYNWSDWYAGTPNVDLKYIVTAFTSSWVAVDALCYDLTITDLAEIQTQLDVLRDIMMRTLATLKEKDIQDWIEEND